MRISDWSSDVCSSDLQHGDRSLAGAISRSFWCGNGAVHGRYVQDDAATLPDHISADGLGAVEDPIYIDIHGLAPLFAGKLQRRLVHGNTSKIGRASCRERVCQYV